MLSITVLPIERFILRLIGICIFESGQRFLYWRRINPWNLHHYTGQKGQQVKYFEGTGVSKGLLAKIKFQGGKIFVNDHEQNVLFSLAQNDRVTIVIPPEGEHETMLADPTPIEIVYEDAIY